MNGEIMVEWEGVRVEVPGFLGATSSPIAWVGAVLGVVGAVMIARRLGVSAIWTYGVGAVMFGLASGLGTFALVVEDSADVYLVGTQFIRDMFLAAAAMSLIGLVCLVVGWRDSREAAPKPRRRAATLAGMGGLGGGLSFTGFIYVQSGDVIDGIGGDSPGTTALELIMPAVGVLLWLGAAGMIAALLLQPVGARQFRD
jgi:hypothetical protein